MLFKPVYKCLCDNFIGWGWLTPAFFPVLEVVGRAPLNICIAIYLAWGMCVLFERGLGAERNTVLLYFAVVSVFGLSLLNAVDLYKGAHTWLKFSFVILTYFMTCHALSADRENWKRQFRLLAIAGILTVIALLIRGGITYDWQRLVPVRGMFERNLPFLLPFLLFLLSSIPVKVVKWAAYCAATVTFSMVIVYSGGRSALVGLVVVLALYGALGFRLKWRYVLCVCCIVVFGAAILGGPKGVLMTRGLSLNAPIDLDRLSTGRTALWRQSFEHPPANQFLGVGVNNTRHYEDVIFIKNVAGMPDQKVKSLHNFFFDLWYETGFAGLFVYLLYVGSMIRPSLRNWKQYSFEQKTRFAPVISAIVAIFVSGCLSFSYTSPQMSAYLFFLMATLTSLSRDVNGMAMDQANS